MREWNELYVDRGVVVELEDMLDLEFNTYFYR
jgi:hypothetical protein